MKERRNREIKNRKSFLPTTLVILLLISLLGFLILVTSPDNIIFVFLFLILCFFLFLFSFSLIMANTRRGLIAATAVTLFLALRYFGVGNLLNGMLILGVTIATEIYFWYSGERK